MSFPYKNPISSIQVNGTQSVPRNNTYGTTFSVNNTGGYMEVYSLSDLYYTIPSGTTGSIEYSGNTIPIEFTKGTGAAWSPDVITLASDNISSGRRRLGMLAYVYEEDQVYQYYIDNYETLFNSATASTGCAQVSNFGTTINNKTAAGQSFINAWTGNTIEDVSGETHTTAVWRKFSSGASSGGTSGTSLYIVGVGNNSTVRCGVNNTAAGDFGGALAGSGNTASGKYSFVGGGRVNTASCSYSTVGGGYCNTAIADDSTVSGGQSNTASGCRSTVSGGYSNTASNYYSTVSGGRYNTSSGNDSTIGGGYCNTSSGTTSTISGGYCNINGGDSAFIGAGRCNTMVGITGGIIGGGTSNTVSSNYSVIGGGTSNTASGYISFVGGGYSNTSSGNYSFIGGGSTNTSSGYYSFIGGGYQNTISNYPSTGPSFSSILNGSSNTISGTSKIGSYSVIIGGSNNFVSDSFIGVFGCNIVASCPNTFYTNDFCSCGSIYSSALSSGQAVCTGTNGLLTNYTPVSPVIIQGSCTTSSIRCGVGNSATADFSASLAGTGNTASGLASVVVGGFFNNTNSSYSFVGAGSLNKVCSCSSSVVGGFSNTACGIGSFIGGGTLNLTSGTTASIVGGGFNTAGGACSFIGGGNLNTITSGGTFSIIGSGVRNTICGNHGSVLGGSGNTVTGSFSSAIGCGLNASANCTLYTNNIITGTISATTYNNLPSVVGLYLPLSGGTVTGGTIFQSGLTANTVTISGSTLTGSGATSALDISQTWNTSGTPIALKVNVTDTASAALSDLISLQVGGSVRFRVVKSGFFTFNTGGEIAGNLVVGGASIDASSILEARSTTKGFLPPRMTSTQRDAISSPTTGLTVYQTTDNYLSLFNGVNWQNIVSPNSSGNIILNSITGSTLIGTTANTGTFKLDVRGATRLSATTGTSLTVISSGNSTSVPVFSVQGSQGELFSVTDSLTGSLFSVSDISGLPILEVFSDSTTIIGDYQAPSLYTTKRVSSITATTGTTIYSFPTSAYTSSYVDYNVSGSTGLRAGNIMAIWSGSTVNFTETSTNDLGNTTPLTFGFVMSGSNAVLQASASTSTWIVKTIVRGL